MAGICLRGKPGWGDLGASFTTVLNTFGGTWWSSTPNGTPAKAQVDQPAFKAALDFYAKLVQDAGEKDAANSSFNECLAQYQAGKVAMWYDATVAAGLLEANDSPVKGKNGYALAPVEKTKASGLAVELGARDPEELARPARTAWKYIAWATGPQYIKAAGHEDQGRLGGDPAGHARCRPTRSRSTRRRRRRSPRRRWRRWRPRRSTTPARRSVRVYRACSTSASRSSRTSATGAPSSSRA